MTEKVIRDKAFADRLADAIELHPHAPAAHGRQSWLRQKLEEAGHKLSREAVRKWFAGEARPRPNIMTAVAEVLDCDEAWLSLNKSPAVRPRERVKQNALTNGAVNLVAGQIQLAGGTIAFPEGEGSTYDLFTILKGKQVTLAVRLGKKMPGFRISIPSSEAVKSIVVMPTDEPTVFQYHRVPQETIARHGVNRGGYIDLDIDRSERGSQLFAGDDLLPMIQSFTDL